MTEFDYRTYPALANSDLTELAERVIGAVDRYPPKQQTLNFGTDFHRLVLQPDIPVFIEQYEPAQQKALVAMTNATLECLKNSFIDVRTFEVEKVELWTCPYTGLALKCKKDGKGDANQRRVVLDLKSTSCNTQEKFEASIYEYKYNRQMAFYLDNEPDNAVALWLGVQKIQKTRVFPVEVTRSHPMYYSGRAQMLSLLQRAKMEFAKPNGWRPSAWTLTREEFNRKNNF